MPHFPPPGAKSPVHYVIRSFLHAPKHHLIVLLAASCPGAPLLFFFVYHAAVAIFHFHIDDSTSIATSKTLWHLCCVTIDEARATESRLIQILSRQGGYRRCVFGEPYISGPPIATNTATKQLNCRCKVAVLLAGIIQSG